jgi:hypothetical protein
MPFYIGGSDESFDPEKTGAILIQVKNREREVTSLGHPGKDRKGARYQACF